MESLLPLSEEVVTVLLLAVRAVRVVTSHRKIACSKESFTTKSGQPCVPSACTHISIQAEKIDYCLKVLLLICEM